MTDMSGSSLHANALLVSVRASRCTFLSRAQCLPPLGDTAPRAGWRVSRHDGFRETNPSGARSGGATPAKAPSCRKALGSRRGAAAHWVTDALLPVVLLDACVVR